MKKKQTGAPKEVLGVKVTRVIDTWYVDDLHGSRSYCLVRTEDRREVTMLRTEEGWMPTIVTGARI